MVDDALFDYVRSSVDQPPLSRLSSIHGLIIRRDGLRDLAHRALRFCFEDRRGIPRAESLLDNGVVLEGDYGDCLQDFICAVSQELLEPDMGKYHSYKPGQVLDSGRAQTLDNFIAYKVGEWHFPDWIKKWGRAKVTEFDVSEDSDEKGHALAAAASIQLQRRVEAEPISPEESVFASLLSLRLWRMNRHAPTDTVPAAYGALQLWPQIDWNTTPARELVAFCQRKWPEKALENIADEHKAAEAKWKELNARLEAQVKQRWSSATNRKESITRSGRYLVKAIFCPLTNARVNDRIERPSDDYKPRERYYDLLDARTRKNGGDQEIDGFLALPLPNRRWVQRKGGRDFDPAKDTVDAWLRVEVGAKTPKADSSSGEA